MLADDFCGPGGQNAFALRPYAMPHVGDVKLSLWTVISAILWATEDH
jgi:hypothetical protein